LGKIYKTYNGKETRDLSKNTTKKSNKGKEEDDIPDNSKKEDQDDKIRKLE
jgi:hypothetical protein